MTQFIALFFSSMSLLNSPTVYMNSIEATVSLQDSFNACSVTNSTQSLANYIYNLYAYEKTISKKRYFKATEQTVIFFPNKNPLIVSKFLAPFQWIILAIDEDPAFQFLGSVTNSVNRSEHFAISTDSITLVNYADSKAKTLNLKYKVYRGQEYLAKDRIDFTFKPK